MKILILGAGKMGSFFTDLLSFQHETAVYDIDPKRLRFVYNTCHVRLAICIIHWWRTKCSWALFLFLEKKEWLYYFVRQRGNTVG